MTITDLTSMGEPQADIRAEINDRLTRLQHQASDYCYQCAKCTSGCEAHKLLELEPHKIVALLKRGLLTELVNSDVIWTCMTCMKCRERCPQKIAPVEILFAAKNLAVQSGKELPGKYTAMLQSILGTGLLQEIQSVTSTTNAIVNREQLSLPPLSMPIAMQKP